MPPNVLFGAFKETVGDVIGLAAAAKVVPDEDKAKQQVAQKSLLEGVKVFKTPPQGPAGAQPGQPPAQPQPAQPQAPVAPPPDAVQGVINQAMGAV